MTPSGECRGKIGTHQSGPLCRAPPVGKRGGVSGDNQRKRKNTCKDWCRRKAQSIAWLLLSPNLLMSCGYAWVMRARRAMPAPPTIIPTTPRATSRPTTPLPTTTLTTPPTTSLPTTPAATPQTTPLPTTHPPTVPQPTVRHHDSTDDSTDDSPAHAQHQRITWHC